MIDPTKITNFNRTDFQLEEFLLFCIVVAGKTASVQAQKLDRLLSLKVANSPFGVIEFLIKDGSLLNNLKMWKLGKYKLIEKGFREVLKLNLRTCTLTDLLSVTGIGLKTAKFFLCHSRANERHAVLDTHILKWLRDIGYTNIPKVSPQSLDVYTRIEGYFLDRCDLAKMSPAALDLEIWNKYSKK